MSKTLAQFVDFAKGIGLSDNLASISFDPQAKFSSVCYDSRAVREGSVFVCVSGEHTDGNLYIDEAVRQGAIAIVSDQLPKTNLSVLSVPFIQVKSSPLALAEIANFLYDSPSRKLRLLAVTGTNGKTTTTHLIEHILNKSGRKTGLIGTLGTRVGEDQSYSDAKHTTPQASDLHRILHQMVEAGCSHVAMEVSSHALIQHRVGVCEFASACFTNLTQDHLDFHRTMENYVLAKRVLFEMLEGSHQENKAAIINLDDPYGSRMLEVVSSQIPQYSYGFGQNADIKVTSCKFDSSGSKLSISTKYGDLNISTRLTGDFNVYNILAAVAVVLHEGVSISDVESALSEFGGVPGRFELVSLTAGSNDLPTCIVDYAHTPDGLENVLKTARGILPEGKKLIVVVGCGGDRDPSKRPVMGDIAERHADKVYITSDNPRSEDPSKIIADILAGIRRLKSVEVEADRSKAIKMAVRAACSGDVVVVAGKGHEDYQILGDKTIHFDDREEVRKALEEIIPV